MKDLEIEISFEVKELMKKNFCYDENTGRAVTWCLYYNEKGCPKTCSYSKKINQPKIK